MELRNICNHPYLSQLHAEEVSSYLSKMDCDKIIEQYLVFSEVVNKFFFNIVQAKPELKVKA